MRGEVEHGAEVVTRVFVHGLGEADVGADGGAEEVEDPEGGDDAVVEFSVSLAGGCVLQGGGERCIPVYALDAGDVRLIAGFCNCLVWIGFWIWLFLGVGGSGIFCNACRLVWWHCVCDVAVRDKTGEKKKK